MTPRHALTCLLTAALLSAACEATLETSDGADLSVLDMAASPDLATPDDGDMPGLDAAPDPQDAAPDLVGEEMTPGDMAPADMAPDMVVEQDMGPSRDSAGCVSGAGLSEGEHTFMLEGRARRYVLRLPQGYTRDRAWPVVFALHGNGGDTSYWDGTSGTRNIRAVLKDDAILVVAQAIDKQWRDYNMPSDTWPARIESELRYFDTIRDALAADLCIDERAVFSMGFSGGGSFSGVLGCRRDYIRAIAVGGSVLYFDEADCVQAPPAWITIGTKELNSGRADFRDLFRDRAQCAQTAQPVDPAPCTAYDGCAPDTPVHYCQHPDDHIWPAFGSAAMWAFFNPLIPPRP
jgi:polyhydroxybutyrate depolymerase